MKIVLDAMGGDRAPSETVAGGLDAAREYGHEVILVGKKALIDGELSRLGPGDAPVKVLDAPEIIEPGESPASAVRRKRDSSLMVGLGLVKEGKADAFVSAGNTGAFMGGALLSLGRIPGIERPALGTVIPTRTRQGVMLLDMGANMDSAPENLLQYGLMGSLYMELVAGLERPRVGLLNVGTESGKGNELARNAFELLSSSGLNFVGNVEGRDVHSGVADVIVCDGFVGNVLLKHTEGMATQFFALMKEELTRGVLSKLGAFLLKRSLRRLAKRVDYAEYGGALLLGVNGVCIKCHGTSDRRAIKNGIRIAGVLAARHVVKRIRENILGAQGEEG